MSNLIQRNRYFDGEFLRSFDLGDEQAYHVALRRRLNRSLHLYGIVEGLELEVDPQGGINQVSITPGLAIDAFGREIFLFAPYAFGDDDVTANRITGNAIVDVWICYRKTAATLPSSGYGQCNDPNQYTRWQESYAVILVKQGTVPFVDPGFVDPDTDDPELDKVGVLLGSVSVNPGAVTNLFANPQFDNRRVFIGNRVQRLRPAVDPTKAGTVPYPILSPNTALNPPASLGVETNLFVEQNLVVGDDFNVNIADISPKPTGAYPPPNAAGYIQGVVKVAGDLFAKGNVFSYSNELKKFLAFKEVAKQSLPDVLTDQTGVSPGPSATGLTSGTQSFVLTSSKITQLSSVVPFASISAFQFQDKATFEPLWAGFMPQVSIIAVGKILGPAPNQCTISVTWTVGPSTATHCAIRDFTISVIAVCYS
jgi:hypothetical protein